jgi:PAS domain S-box-containing protein
VYANYGKLEQRIQKKKYVVDCKWSSGGDLRRYNETVFDMLRSPFLILDSSLIVLTANQAFYHSFHLSPENTVGNLIYRLDKMQWDIPELRELLEQILPQYGSVADFSLEHRFRRLGCRKIMLNARQVHCAGGTPVFTLLSMEDVTEQSATRERLRQVNHDLETLSAERNGELRRALEYLTQEMIERKRAEEEARESEDHYKLLLKNLGEDIVLIDSGHRITGAANETLITSGFPRDRIIGRPCFEILHGCDVPCNRRGNFCPLPEVVESGRAFVGKHLHRRADGSTVQVEVLLAPMRDDTGRITHMIEAMRDTRRAGSLKL